MVNFNNDDLVKEIKRRLSITDLIEGYTSIKKSGKGYVGLCPFHDDHNPSMHVDDEKGLFHCFSCGAGGDILGFYMRYNNLTFPEAVSELAKKANISVERRAPASKKKTKSEAPLLYKVNSAVSKFYHRVLLESSKARTAREYLSKRNITDEIIEEFTIGYAPSGWDTLVKSLTKNKVPLPMAEKLGLVVKRSSGDGYYDRFRDRIIFPIKNVDGNVIGFGGRIVEANDQPKYINSPESEIYQKRRSFYGLDKSRDEIRKSRRVILVEGYTDFLALYSAGIKNVAATLGTALTRDHISVLRRYTDRIVVVFDGDDSGVKAAVRSLDLFLEEGLSPHVALLPEGRDPDSFLSEEGREKFLQVVDNSPSLLDFYIDNAINDFRRGELTLKRTVGEIADALKKVNDPLLRNRYGKKTAERLGIGESELLMHLRTGRERHGRVTEARSAKAYSNHEKLLLTIILKFPQLSSLVREHDWRELVSSEEIRAIMEEVVENEIYDMSSLLLRFQDDAAQGIISEAIMSSTGISDEETARKMIQSCVRQLRHQKLGEGLKSLRLEIEEAVRNKDVVREKELLKEYAELMKQNNRKKGEPYE